MHRQGLAVQGEVLGIDSKAGHGLRGFLAAQRRRGFLIGILGPYSLKQKAHEALRHRDLHAFARLGHQGELPIVPTKRLQDAFAHLELDEIEHGLRGQDPGPDQFFGLLMGLLAIEVGLAKVRGIDFFLRQEHGHQGFGRQVRSNLDDFPGLKEDALLGLPLDQGQGPRKGLSMDRGQEIDQGPGFESAHVFGRRGHREEIFYHPCHPTATFTKNPRRSRTDAPDHPRETTGSPIFDSLRDFE